MLVYKASNSVHVVNFLSHEAVLLQSLRPTPPTLDDPDCEFRIIGEFCGMNTPWAPCICSSGNVFMPGAGNRFSDVDDRSCNRRRILWRITGHRSGITVAEESNFIVLSG
uniref:Uncharacterized protein n=1 Tax=Ananas comosus var. bracteatus TaxID=296719 RepID=A0A6V7QT15_ANACO